MFSQSSGPSLILSIVPSACEETVSLLCLPQPHISLFSPLPATLGPTPVADLRILLVSIPGHAPGEGLLVAWAAIC